MFDRIFGNYLLESGTLTYEQLDAAYEAQEKNRSKLGLIAVAEQMMSYEQADEVNKLQAVIDKPFGEIAIASGYLTSEQVKHLLHLQGNRYLTFIQAIVDLEYLELSTLQSILALYQKENGYTTTDIENMKSCEIDRVLPYMVEIENNVLYDLVGTFIRTVARLMNYNVFLEPSYETKSYKASCVSYQISEGDHRIFSCISADCSSMMGSAVSFAGEKFVDTAEDALDANAEFVNCVNGLFATRMSNEADPLELDMYPPLFHEKISEIKGEHIFVIPVKFDRVRFDLLVSIDNEVQIQ